MDQQVNWKKNGLVKIGAPRSAEGEKEIFGLQARHSREPRTECLQQPGQKLRHCRFTNTFIERPTPLPKLLETLDLQKKPVWIRLVAFGYLCVDYVGSGGKDLGFQRRSYPLADFLEATRDRDVLDQLKDYEEGCRLLTEVTL